MTAAQEQNQQLQRRLQQDSIQLAGKTIYINPFLYWRRFDSNTCLLYTSPSPRDS